VVPEVNVKPLPAGYRYNTPIESSVAKMLTTMHHIKCERIIRSFSCQFQSIVVVVISALPASEHFLFNYEAVIMEMVLADVYLLPQSYDLRRLKTARARSNANHNWTDRNINRPPATEKTIVLTPHVQGSFAFSAPNRNIAPPATHSPAPTKLNQKCHLAIRGLNGIMYPIE
jgi:hypothetical protein